MREKAKRLFKKVILGLVILFLAALLAAGIKWYLTAKSSIETSALAPLSASVEKPRLGETFFLKTTLKVPWGRPVPKSSAPLLPAGLQMRGEGELAFRKLAWGYTLYDAVLPLQGYETGKTKGGISWLLTHTGGKDITLSFPAVTIEKLVLKDPVLAMASSYTPPKKRNLYPYFIGGIALLILLAAAMIWYLRRKKHPSYHIIPPWEEARNAISLLVRDVRNGKKKTEKALTYLSDILSSYIEKRFSIRSTHLTSGEFLHELEKNSSILEESHQHFLRKFLESAELVKFAALPAGNDLWEQAAKDAEKFIEETRIKSAKEEKKQ